VQAKLVTNKVFVEGWLEQFNTVNPIVLQCKVKEKQIVFALPYSITPGVYRLHLDRTNQKPYVDLIIDGIESKIVFEIQLYGVDAMPVFQESIENTKWYDYIKKATQYVDRLNGLFNYLSVFHDQSIDRVVQQIYNRHRDKYYSLFSKFCTKNNTSWACLLVKNRPYYFSDLRNKPVERDFIRRNFFWEDIDTNNFKLINTPLYNELIKQYFETYFINSKESYTSVQKEYLINKEKDFLLEKFSNNLATKVFIKNYINDYFKS
jgi:hypothetical protein